LTPETIKKRKSVIVGLYSSIVLALLALPSVYIHEIGHLIICAADGSEFTLDINVFGGTLYCHVKPVNGTLFLAFGGIFAMMVLSVPLAWKKISRTAFISIPLLSLVIGHGINSIIETFLAQWYLQNQIITIVLLNTLVAASFFALFYFVVIKKERVEKH